MSRETETVLAVSDVQFYAVEKAMKVFFANLLHSYTILGMNDLSMNICVRVILKSVMSSC